MEALAWEKHDRAQRRKERKERKKERSKSKRERIGIDDEQKIMLDSHFKA